jgi:predicted PurR-regulated permease PerM
MPLFDARTLRVLFTGLIFFLAVGFLYAARITLIAFLFAIFFAYLVDPAVSRIERWLHSRAAAIALIYLLLGGLLFTFFFFVGPQIGRQTKRFTEAFPNLLNEGNFAGIVSGIAQQHGWNGATFQQIEQFLADHQSGLASVAQHIGLRVAEMAQQSWLLIVVPILAVFFLKDGRGFSEVILAFPDSRPQREFLEGVLDDMNQMLAQFIRAQLILALLSFVVYITFMGSMRVPYALALSAAAGALEFIPVVGPLSGGALIMGVALLSSYPHWLMVLGFLLVWRLVQDYVVSPRIMGHSMELHPLAALFGVLAGAEVAGVLGVYLSIPVMASVRIFWRRWRVYLEKKRFGPLNDYTLGSDIGGESTPF